ncbi:MAG: RIO1 family regulatory kinase/ATPase, partial [Candidatus Bathyarchaeia archaeon]
MTQISSYKFSDINDCADLICYPKLDHEEFKKRLVELKELGVYGIEVRGCPLVSGFRVLGKGCVGIVVSALTETGKTALKIRRLDADRINLLREVEMLKIANSVDVGPKLISATKNFILMELIDGVLIHEWLKARSKTKKAVRNVLTNLLEQCFRLDSVGLDHGELSDARKHVIIDGKGHPVIIDFESASNSRRPSNLTSICSFLFLGGFTAKFLSGKLEGFDRDKLINSLKTYKAEQNRN